ncbi:MAG: Glu-tRNA(Gln) amidotransferase subunit GatE [Candidatus Woesearchaeota archaeon]
MIDYTTIGLKCGLEIHQQLNTKKLFCNCNSVIVEEPPDFSIRRRLRAVAGETGEIDVAAIHEMLKDKYIIYEGYYNNTCLVELDEEPPHNMNSNAFYACLQMAKILNAKINDYIHVMRKTVVDGSNTSGFQRTALVAVNGFLELNNKKIQIPTLCLEEDAARIISAEKEFTVYRLDRLGIPLIEIATDASISSPEECKEVAAYIGMLLRSTGKVRRGIGTIRQDVNISIKEGNRVEIKGAQDLRLLPKIVEYEVLRQKNLIELKQLLLDKKIKFNKKDIKIFDLTKIFDKTNCKIIQQKKSVFGIKIKDFKGLFGRETQPGRRVGSELSDYGKTRRIKGLFHSDEQLSKYNISMDEVNKIEESLKINKNDAFILIAEEKDIAEKAFDVILDRISHLFVGVPKEVRNANDDGTSSFLRPMPGSSRMYPETDIYPITPDLQNIELPELISDKILRMEKNYKISKELATIIVKEGIEIERYIQKYKNIKPTFIAEFFYSMPIEFKKRYNIDYDPENFAEELFAKINNNEISYSAVEEIIVKKAKGEIINFSDYSTIDEKILETKIMDIIDKNKNASMNALMGIAMKELKGKTEGKKIMQLLKKFLIK